MQLLNLIFTLLALLSTTQGSRHTPPFCTPTGLGFCNLGWQYDQDKHSFEGWIYDRSCQQIGHKWNMGYFQEDIPSSLPFEFAILSKTQGPSFCYAEQSNCYTWSAPGECSCYEGDQDWKYACQCAFRCNQQPDSTAPGQPEGPNPKRDLDVIGFVNVTRQAQLGA